MWFANLIVIHFLLTFVKCLSETVLIKESNHPYLAKKTCEAFTFENAVAYSIQFDSSCNISRADFLYFSQYSSCAYSTWGSPYYSGPPTSPIWNFDREDYSVIVYSKVFYIYFSAVSNGTNWGYKIYITPLFTMPAPSLLIIDTLHNYDHLHSFSLTISIPNAAGYYLQFDDRSSTYYTDYASISSSNIYLPMIAGNIDTGVWTANSNITISSESFQLSFAATQSKITDFGFKAYIYPILAGSKIPIQEKLIIDSPHPYGYIYHIGELNNPDAVAYEIQFDENCDIALNNYDFLSLYFSSSRSFTPYFAGKQGAEIWQIGQPLIVYGNVLNFLFSTFSKSNGSHWGFRFNVTVLLQVPEIPKKIAFDTIHPYQRSASGGPSLFSKAFSIPGVIGYYLQFDERSSTHYTDYASVKDSSGITLTFAGSSNSGIWTANNNISIYSDTFTIAFTATQTINSDFGFRIYIYPIKNEINETSSIALLNQVILDSPHPYGPANYGASFAAKVQIPGAIAYLIRFDERCEIDLNNVDYLKITPATTSYFAGPVNSLIWNLNSSQIIYSSSFTTIFYTSNSGFILKDHWGYRIYCTPLFELPADRPLLITTDTIHPYYYHTLSNTLPTLFNQTINVLGAVGYRISFDSRTNLSLHYDSSNNDCDTFSIGVPNGNPSYPGYVSWGNPIMNGAYSSDLWGNITIYASSFEFLFDFSGGSNAWGVRAYVEVIINPNELPLQPTVQFNSPFSIVPEQYSPVIWIPGATSYLVSFNSRTSMDPTNEILIFYRDLWKSSYWGQSNYSGSAANNPVFSPFLINASFFVLDYKSIAKTLSGGYQVQVQTLVSPQSCSNFSNPVFINDTIMCECDIGASRMALLHRYSFNEFAVYDSVGHTPLYSKSSVGFIAGNHLNFVWTSSSSSSAVWYSNVNIAPNSNVVSFELWISVGESKDQAIFEIINPSDSSSLNIKLLCHGNYLLGIKYQNSYFDSNTSLLCFQKSNWHLVLTLQTVPTGIISTVYSDGVYLFSATLPSTQKYLTISAFQFSFSTKESSIMIDEFRVYGELLRPEDIARNYQFGSDVSLCYPCPLGTYSPTTGANQCTLCPSHSYAKEEGQFFCEQCSADSTAVPGSSFCLCDAGFYMSPADTCAPCKAGYTSDVGSVGSQDCANIASSFVFAFVFILVCLLSTLFYLTSGRIYTIARGRQEFYMQSIIPDNFQVISTIKARNANVVKTIKRHIPHTATQVFISWLKIAAMLLLLVVVTIGYFITSMIRILFSSIILSRAVFGNNQVIDSINAWITFIDHNLQGFKYIFQPFVQFIQVINLFQINYSAVSIDCSGSQAAGELLVDLMILFVVIIIIVADCNILISFPISESCKHYLLYAYQFLPNAFVTFLLSFVTWIIAELRPLPSFLQYLMTLITIHNFIADHGHHTTTAKCNAAQSIPNLDYVLAILSSLVAYMLLIPSISTIARIVYPGMPNRQRIINPNCLYCGYCSVGETAYFKYYDRTQLKEPQKFTSIFPSLRIFFQGYVNLSESHPENNQQTEIAEKKDSSKSCFSVLRKMIFSFDLFIMSGFAALTNWQVTTLKTKGDAISNEGKQKEEEVEEKRDVSAYISGRFYELPTLNELAFLIAVSWDRDYEGSCLVARLFAYTPLALFTTVGRFYWYCVWWKLSSFLRICLGFWSDSSINQYQFPLKIQQFLHSIRDTTTTFYEPKSLDVLAALIIPRVTLLQIIPIFTYVSIFTQSLANSPLSNWHNCSVYDPIYFSLNPCTIIEKQQEAAESQQGKEEKWVKFCMKMSVVLRNWHPLKIVYNLFCFCVVAALVWLPSAYWSRSSTGELTFITIITLIMVFHAFLCAIPFAVKFGRAQDIRDDDFVCKSKQSDSLELMIVSPEFFSNDETPLLTQEEEGKSV